MMKAATQTLPAAPKRHETKYDLPEKVQSQVAG
jgi:hypothetical protein